MRWPNTKILHHDCIVFSEHHCSKRQICDLNEGKISIYDIKLSGGLTRYLKNPIYKRKIDIGYPVFIDIRGKRVLLIYNKPDNGN